MEDFSEIPQASQWREITPIEKGWSGDKKYRIVDREGRSLLLRTSDSGRSQRKAEEFRILLDFAKTGATMSMPVEWGLFDKQRRVYTLLTWLEGVDAAEHLTHVSPSEQYRLGCEAGKALRLLHTVAAPGPVQSWEERYSRKIDTKLRNYQACPRKLPGEAQFLNFIAENRHLLKDREQTCHHGDFHVGNLIITPQSTIGIIDFNRVDYGDPWEEFNRIVFCSQASPGFAAGRVNGYFGDEVPEQFFRLLALYIAVNCLSSLPWAVPFGEKEVTTMLQQAKSILGFYKNFSTVVPTWYSQSGAHRAVVVDAEGN